MGDDIPIEIDFPMSDAMGRGGTVSAEQPEPEGAGIRLGRYTTVRLLGKGGMAEVYLAHQDGPAGFKKTCVVKRMRKVLSDDPRFVEMFLREARIAARLNHNNVVQIFELVQEQGEYFIAMEYLDGISLHRAARRCWANETSIPMEVILRSVADAALGLNHAHTQRDPSGALSALVHRDVSPDNLVITRDGITKVLDFGIAKAGSEVDEVTMTGELKGKIPYLSPEQIRGEALDGRSDLWALGVTLYWLLAGKRPFDGGSDHMTIDHILRAKPQPPRELNPLIPQPLENIILSLLQKDRNNRLGSGMELRDRLATMLGPSAGPGPASSFCNRVMDMAPIEKRVGPTTILTIVPARPETQWLKRVSAGDDNADLVAFAPLPVDAPTVSLAGKGPSPHVDTAETITNVSGQFAIAPETPGGRLGAVAAGAGLLVVLAVAGLWLLGGDENAPSSVPNTPVRVAIEGGTGSAPVTSAAQNAVTIPVNVPLKENPASTANTKVATATPATDGEAAPEVIAPAATKAPASEPVTKSEAKKQPNTKSRAVRGIAIKARAPNTISWRTTKGKRLGKGNTTLSIPKGSKTVVAVDSRTGGKTSIAVTGGAVDYGAVKSGQLMLRIRPWAKASIGRKVLGTTPMDAVKLKAGRYRVKLVWNDKTTTKTVDVRPGRQSVLKVDMRKE